MVIEGKNSSGAGRGWRRRECAVLVKDAGVVEWQGSMSAMVATSWRWMIFVVFIVVVVVVVTVDMSCEIIFVVDVDDVVLVSVTVVCVVWRE